MKSRHHDHREPRPAVANRSGEVDPCPAAWHVHVGDDDVEDSKLQEIESIDGRSGFDHLPALLPEAFGEIHADQYFVFDEEDPQRGFALRVGQLTGLVRQGLVPPCSYAASTSDPQPSFAVQPDGNEAVPSSPPKIFIAAIDARRSVSRHCAQSAQPETSTRGRAETETVTSAVRVT